MGCMHPPVKKVTLLVLTNTPSIGFVAACFPSSIFVAAAFGSPSYFLKVYTTGTLPPSRVKEAIKLNARPAGTNSNSSSNC
jgi:hypothetical protein